METGKIEVTVKTMDSGQQKFEVNEEVTVATFKEDIATQMNIPIERQRLIFQGKVLRDDKKLSEYGVANKVIHLVQKAPPTPNADGTSTSTTSTSSAGVTTTTSSQFIVGTIPLRNPSNINPASITQHIAQHIAGQIAAATGSNTTTVMATHESQMTPSSAAATVATSEEATDGTSPNVASRSEGHQVHSLLTQAHSLLMRCKQHLDQFDQESADNIQVLMSSLDKGEQPMDTMATDQSTSESAATATGSNTTGSTTAATGSETMATENSTENTIPTIDGPYGATLLADVYDDMATVNGRLATLQSQWASIVRSDIQLQESQAAIVNKLYTTIRACQAHMTHVEVCTMRLSTQLTRPPPHVVELVDTSSSLAGLLQPSTERQFQIGPLSIMSQTYSIPQAVLHAHMTTTPTPTTSVSDDINQQLGGVISQVLDSMMNRTIGSSLEQQPTPTTSTNAGGSAGTAVTSVATEAVVSSQPVVSSSQPVASTPSMGSESEEVRSKLPGATPTKESQSSSKDDQSVPMATEHPKEGSSTSDRVPSTAPVVPAEEQRRPRLTIRLVHRPRGAPRSSILDSDSDDDNTITINLNSDSDDEISDQPSGVETRDAEGNLTTEYRAMLNTLQRRQERRERQLVNILQHRRREIQNREVTQRLAQLTEARSAPPLPTNTGIPGATGEGDGGESSSDEEMDPQEALAAVRRLTRSLLPMMLGPQGQLTIHDLWMDIQANRGPDWVPPDQTIVSHLLEYVARGLTVAQLFEIFSGSAEPMQGLHPYLLEFVREKLLNNEIPTPHNKQKAIDTLMERLQDYIDKIAEPVKVHPGINLRETINRCLQFSLGDVYDIIINKPEGEQAFGQALWGWCVNMAARIAAVTRHCMDGTEEEFQDVLRSFFTRNRDHGDDDDGEEGMGVTPMSAFFTVSMVRRLNNFIEHCNFTQEDFDKFIVKDRPVDQTVDQPGPSGTSPEEATEVPNNDSTTLEASSEPVAMDTAPSEQWPANMPQEWIPVIQYDVEYMATTEEDQSGDQQVPLSDAYMSGMPAKRRKVEKRPQAMPQVLQDCLQSAIVKTGVKPTSEKDVVKEIGNQEQLCQALGEELYIQTRQRLQEDKNYQPAHYPNAERYYRPHN